MTIAAERLWQQFLAVPPPWPQHPDAGPYCGCCLHIIRAGDEEPRRVPAAYIWTTQAGDTALCVRCCAIWRENATADPDLMPLHIHSIGQGC